MRRSLESTSRPRSLAEKHGAKVLARVGIGEYDVIEGDWRPRRLVILEYPSLEAIHDFYNDPEFQPVKRVRQAVPGTYTQRVM